MSGIENIITEIFLVVLAMSLLVAGAFSKVEGTARVITGLTGLGFLISLYIITHSNFSLDITRTLSFNEFYIFDDISIVIKLTIALIGFFCCVIALNDKYLAGGNNKCFEFPVILILLVLGSYMLVSANDLFLMYMGLELMSLSSYILVSLNRENEKSTEAGLKYFILGALASCIILFGASLVYGFLGTTNLVDINIEFILADGISELPIAATIGFVLVLTGFFFKVSAVPMHMWAPDVYEGSNKSVLAIISTIPKIAAVIFILRFVYAIGEDLYKPYSVIISCVAAASLILGAFAALKQEDIKRLLAYSSIANMGFVLLAIAVGNMAAFESAVIYIIIYSLSVVGIISLITVLQKKNSDFSEITALAGLAKTSPLYAFALATLMFSVAGIPPLAGFWAKFLVLISAINSKFYILAVIGIISSAVACFYYLRIVKVMYFDDPAAETKNLNPKGDIYLKLIIAIIILFTLTISFYIADIREVVSNSLDSLN